MFLVIKTKKARHNIMYQSPYLVQILHEDRVREAMKNASLSRRVYDLSEPVPNEYNDGLLHRIAQWINVKNQPKQESPDARRAHAL
jgi:hypothetical protein